METLTVVLLVALVLALGAVVMLVVERQRLIGERDLARARLSDEERSRQTFEALAGQVLRDSNAEFLRLAKESMAAGKTDALAAMERRHAAVDELIKPIREAIQRTHVELRRVGQDHAGLVSQVQEMASANRELRSETGKLAQALRKPNVRGRYGEIQLERVVELAGMRPYCDFATQTTVKDTDDRVQRPDLIVRLPNERMIAVDAKTSIDAYLDALDAETEEQAGVLLDRYAENVALQAQRLAKRRYWTNFEGSPELVVMFIPGDQLVDAALERRPELLEYAAENNIVIASPSTLIGLLRAVHVGWREKNLTESAEELFQLGQELHRRAAIVIERAAKVGHALDGARRNYNDFVGSVQSRLMPALRRFEERDARSSRDIPELAPIEGETRAFGELAPAPRAAERRAETKPPAAI